MLLRSAWFVNLDTIYRQLLSCASAITYQTNLGGGLAAPTPSCLEAWTCCDLPGDLLRRGFKMDPL